MGGWDWDDEPTSPRDAELIQNARRAYDRVAELVDGARVDPGSFHVSPELILELHAIVTAGEPNPRKKPGVFRTEDNQIRGFVVLFQPPPWQEVVALINEACEQISRKLANGPTLHAAAYALWRLNWIHPFGDGNGKTSRVLMYAILCVGFGRMMPGEVALPDQISRNPYAYWDALKAADKAWANGVLDVSEMEAMLSELIERALPSP